MLNWVRVGDGALDVPGAESNVTACTQSLSQLR